MEQAQTPETIHIAVGGVLGAALAGVVSPVVVADDNLLLGPSRAHLERHRLARARYWGREASTEIHDALAAACGPPLSLALPPTPGGLLCLAQVSAAAIERGRALWVIDLPSTTPATSPSKLDPVRAPHLDMAKVLPCLPPAARYSSLQAAFAATLWRLWCRRSPTGFSRYCASGGALHPLIADLGRYHAGIFPRFDDRALMLSRLDDLILGRLSSTWSTPAQLFASAAAAGSDLHAWLTHTGDLYLAARLLAWSRHAHGRVVERREEAGSPGGEMTRWAFRWHPGGERILDGLPGLGAAPPVSIGGAVAYDPARPWARRLDSAGEPYVSRVAL